MARPRTNGHNPPLTNDVEDAIFRLVKKETGYNRDDIISPQRDDLLSQARHLVVWLVSECTNASLKELSAIVGRTDHSTSSNSKRVVEERRHADTEYRYNTDNLIKAVRFFSENIRKCYLCGGEMSRETILVPIQIGNDAMNMERHGWRCDCGEFAMSSRDCDDAIMSALDIVASLRRVILNQSSS